MVSKGPEMDFSKWTAVVHPAAINVDNSLDYGAIELSGGKMYASAQTIDDYCKWWQKTPVAEDVPSRMETKREFILDSAKSLVVGDRNKQYGEPYDDFKKVSDALNAYGFKGPDGRDMMPCDVAFFQSLVKLSRIIQSPIKDDSWIDLAGYAACGAEVAEVEAANND